MIGPNVLDQTISDTLLRSLIPSIYVNQQWTKHVSILNRVKKILFIETSNNPMRSIQNTVNSIQGKSFECLFCKMNFDNLLLMILHMEVISHRIASFGNQLQKEQLFLSIQKYVFTYESIEIHFQAEAKIQEEGGSILSKFVENFGDGESFIKGSLESRNKAILGSIFSKFSKKIENASERPLFHSYNVYKRISPQSENQQSEQEVTQVEKQLQNLHIQDIIDVNENDKRVFLIWNKLIRKIKSREPIIEKGVMKEALEEFIRICVKENLPRLNIFMHLWTLWSIGRIYPMEILSLMKIYARLVEKRNRQK